MEEPDPKKLRLSSDNSQSTVNQSAETLEYELDIDRNEAFDGAGKENGVGNKGHMPSTEPDIYDKAGRSNCWKNDDYMKNCDSHGEEGRIEHINGFSTERATLMKIESVKKDAVTITNVIPNVDLVDVYKKILARRNVKHRVDLVTLELLEGASEQHDANANASEVIHSPSDEIFKDVAEILLKFPNVDPSYIYDLLERNESKENRVAIVLDKLETSFSEKGTNHISRDCTPPSSVSESLTSNESKKSDPFSDPEFRKNPLYRDLRTLRKVLPAVDPNELYAYLEAHFDKPNRVQIVIDELPKSDSQDSLPVEDNPSLEDTDKGKAPMTTEDKVQADLKGLKEIFRDCDPSFLYEKLVMLYNDSDRVVKIASELFERKDYPKLEETKGVKSDKKHPKDVKFDIREFLVKFPDPFNYFENTERMVSDSYKEHALIYVKNTFPFLKDGFLKKVLNSHKYHLLPAITEIDTAVNDTILDHQSKKRRATPRDLQDFPDVADEPFFQEMLLCQHKQQVKDYLRERRELRVQQLLAARESRELMECGCCYDDECLFEDMAACADGHLFCKQCVVRSSEAAVGEGRAVFKCLTGTCESDFPLHMLQDILKPSLFSLVLRKLQEEELRQADIADLVSCPFCSFATIMPNQEDRVFKCLNPECLRESCRLCKEPNHVPLRCNEVEKQGVTNIRTYIETKVSEAILRTCPHCKKRFLKASGCNKMTCTCGTTMCYVCREAKIDYQHFDNNPRCSIDSDIGELHKQEMMTAAQLAKTQYLADHPDLDPAGLDLDLDQLVKKILGNGGVEENKENKYEEDDYNYEDDYDDDEYM